MAVDEVTVFGADTKELDAKVKASAQKAKAQMDDISRGARVAGRQMAGVGERLRNLSRLGFAGAMTAVVGILIAGIQKATQLADDMLKGALNDAERLAKQLAASMGRENKRVDEAEAAFKFLLDIKNRGSGFESQAERQRAGEALSTLQRYTDGEAVSRIRRSVDRGLQFKPEEEADIQHQLMQKRLNAIDAEIKAKERLANRYRRVADFYQKTGLKNAAAIELYAKEEEVRDSIIDLAAKKDKIKAAMDSIWEQVAARHYDLKERGDYFDRQRITRLTGEYKEKAEKIPDEITAVGKGVTRKPSGMGDQEYLKRLALAAQKINGLVRDVELYASTATANAEMYKNNKLAQEQAKQAEFYKDNAEKIAKGILGSIKKQQLSILGEQKNELLDEAKNIKLQSSVFTNDLTRRGGFQSGGLLWSNDRYQQQMTARVQTIATQLQTLNRNIDKLNTTP